MKKALSLFLALVMIVACLTGISFATVTDTQEATSVAQVVTGGTTQYVSDIADLATVVSKDGTSVVTLLDDVTYNETDALGIPVCTLDLNGYTLSTTTGTGVLYFSASMTNETATNLKIEVKNGTIISTGYAVTTNVGYVHFQNVTIYSSGNGAFRMTNKAPNSFTTNTYRTENLVENSQLHSATNYGFGYGSKASFGSVQFTINDTVVVTESSGKYPFAKYSTYAAPNYKLGYGVDVYAKDSNYTDLDVSKFSGETLTQVDGSHDVTVNGATVEALNKWSTGFSAENAVLNVIPGINGSIADLEPAARGTDVTVVPTADEGYVFSHLVVNGETVEGATFTVPNTDTVAVFAAFRKVPSTSATLKVVDGDNGTIILPVTEAEYGTDVTVIATPAEGYVFSHLLVNGNEVDGSTFTVPETEIVTVQGVFKSNAPMEPSSEVRRPTFHNITVETAVGGTVKVSNEKATINTVIKLEVVAEAGYELESITVKKLYNGTYAELSSDNTFFMPYSKVVITPVFKQVG